MVGGKGNISQLYHRHGCNSLTEMKNEHVMASIEKVFIYFSRYGLSDLNIEECQFGTLVQFKMAAKFKMADKIGGNLLFFCLFFKAVFKEDFYAGMRV